MLRASVLSILILSMVAVSLPVTSEVFESSGFSVEASRRRSSNWRRLRAARRARWRRIQQRRRAALARQRRYGQTGARTAAARWRRRPRPAVRQNSMANTQTNTQHAPPTNMAATNFIRQPMMNVTLPGTWSGTSSVVLGGETRWSVRASDGREAGTAALRPVVASNQIEPGNNFGRAQAIGGVSLSTLRRTVIDRMVAEGGWVTNDFVREIGGRRTFVVTAQIGNPNSPARTLMFYFTELGGRVYSLTTSGQTEHSERLASEATQMLSSLRDNASTAALSVNRQE
jgi:hypothetical protein